MSGLDWRMIAVAVTLLLSWSSVLFAAIRWFLNRYQEHLDFRFSQLERANTARAERVHTLDRDLLTLRADLPNQYVRREDWIRFGAHIDQKLDALYQRIDKLRDEVKNG